MSPISFTLAAFCFTILTSTAQGQPASASVFYDHQTDCYSVKCGQLKAAGSLAYGTYDDSVNTTGWGVLDIAFTSPSTSFEDDLSRMTAAGVIEGALTRKHIYQNYANMAQVFLAGKAAYETRLRDFLARQAQWTKEMAAKNRADPFWQGVSLIMAQLEGLQIGYRITSCGNETLPALDTFALLFLNGIGDTLDLRYALDPASFPDIESLNSEPLMMKTFQLEGHCSALIKALPGFEDIFMAHSTWFTYSSMLRIYKHYNFDLSFKYAEAKRMSFSSYPGELESLDDFYLLGSGMVMLQTTNSIYNQSLYKMVKPESLLAWQRVRVANLMAGSGAQWGEIVSRYNSGTYNNQYMVIDKKRIVGELLNGTLTVVEQIPGLMVSKDQTAILRAGYWPSYNVPFYEEIYRLSGYPEKKKNMGDHYSYQLTVRAEIFRRDQANVVDMKSFMDIMRYNDYRHDKYSDMNPSWAICSRVDLETKGAAAAGCTDTKVTNLAMSETFSAFAVSGPTTSHGLPVFRWTEAFDDSHVGLPQSYDFPFVMMKPSL